jgi:site-specific DNA recombinase
MADELELRGLTTFATPKRAARPVTPSGLHKILTNPYYRGDVVYQGATYRGRHEALTDRGTWQQVQDVLASHLIGEKSRTHDHYLKSTVWCSCGSRLVIQHSKNRHGVTYEYFICVGRHLKRNNCTRQAIPIDVLEEKIVEHYRSVAIPSELRDQLEATLVAELESMNRAAADEERRLHDERRRLDDRRRKLLDAHLGGAVPLDLMQAEQESIATRLSRIEERLGLFSATTAVVHANLEAALNLAENCYEAYRRASPRQRRDLNQALFERIEVDEDQQLDGHLSEPFRTLLDPATIRVVTGTEDDPDESKNPDRAHLPGQGSKEQLLVDPRGFEPLTSSMRTRRATNCAKGP